MNDIREGKLGTRRAAALYGIPRSTLRNKLFKQQTNGSSTTCQTTTDKNLQIPNLSMSDLLQSMASTSGLNTEFYNKDDEESPSWDDRLAMLRRKHNISGTDQPFGLPLHLGQYAMSNVYNTYMNSYLSTLAMTDLDKMYGFASNKTTEGVLQENGSLDLSMPKSSEKKSVDLKIPSYKPSASNTTSSLNDTASCSSSSTGSMSGSDKDLQTTADSTLGLWSGSNNMSGSQLIGNKLKDIIYKTIADKVNGRTTTKDNDASNLNNNENGFKSLLKINTDHNTEHSSPKKQCVQKIKTESSVDANGKKTRPKRGQYRKYNSQLLVEAVKAVQRGEMSVHRAGSYYGVPHSTLEYKVKERHLLRQKKPREIKKREILPKVTPSVTQNITPKKLPSDNAASLLSAPLIGGSLPNSSLPLNDDLSAGLASLAQMQQMSALSSLNPFAPHGLHLASWPGFPSMPMGSVLNDAYAPLMGFAPNTSASDLLKSLQKKVEAKSSPDTPESTSEKKDCDSESAMEDESITDAEDLMKTEQLKQKEVVPIENVA